MRYTASSRATKIKSEATSTVAFVAINLRAAQHRNDILCGRFLTGIVYAIQKTTCLRIALCLQISTSTKSRK